MRRKRDMRTVWQKKCESRRDENMRGTGQDKEVELKFRKKNTVSVCGRVKGTDWVTDFIFRLCAHWSCQYLPLNSLNMNDLSYIWSEYLFFSWS